MPASPWLCERFDRAAGGDVIGRDNGGDLVASLLQRLFGQLARGRGIPLIRPGIRDELHVAALDGRTDDLHLPLAYQLGVVVGGRAADENVVAARRVREEVRRLHLADLRVVEGEIEIDVGVPDQPIVADHRDLLPFRHRDDLGSLVGVVRDDDEGLDAFVQELLGQLDLTGMIPLGRADDDFTPDFPGTLDENVAILLPALVQRVHEEADLGRLAILPCLGRRTPAAAAGRNQRRRSRLLRSCER